MKRKSDFQPGPQVFCLSCFTHLVEHDCPLYVDGVFRQASWVLKLRLCNVLQLVHRGQIREAERSTYGL